ncbi:PIR Superfamily Protein [Plasmodium ovale wallikeri]|uniref:PIR Superfamily Protein n=1 Tax=Plasmodium ovale wallikeri TaxID=864142 RepID=A0A1A9AL32_PLAOA|nr:PIR Superfamily Protein [Plasmodium ovale wallikeri]
MHDFSKDYEKYKIELINADITCSASYKNYLDNHIDNYKKLHSFCGVGINQDTHASDNYVTKLYQANGTFPEVGSTPKTDNSITKHSQIITGVTFSS